MNLVIAFFSVHERDKRRLHATPDSFRGRTTFLTKAFKIESGDILMTRIGSIGDCKLIDWDVDAMLLTLASLIEEFSAAQ